MKKYILPSFLALAFFVTGLFTLSDYGINWDTPFRMVRGQIYLDKVLNTESPKKDTSPLIIKPGGYISRYDVLTGEMNEPSIIRGRPIFKFNKGESFYRDDNFRSFFMDYPAGHPPLIDILSALSNRFLYSSLGFLSDVDSYQIVYIIFASVGIFVVAIFAIELTNSLLAGVVAAFILFLWPTFFSEAHFNMKDPIQASMFAGAIWSFWHWIKDGKLKWFIIFCIFAGFCLTIKWNIVFLLFIIIPWLFLIRNTNEFKKWFKLGKLGLLGGLGLLGMFLFFIAINPPFWRHPLGFLEIIKYYLELGTKSDVIVSPSGFLSIGGFNSYPLFLFLVTTPEIILALCGIGIFRLIKQKGGDLKIGYLLILWLLIPIFRISLPHINFYNGLRQIMEILPAVAILAGVGTSFVIKKSITIIKIIMTITIIAALLLLVIRLHPNENVYFNSLVAGLKGAADKNLIDARIKMTFGNEYKQAADWLNVHAEKNANVAHVDGSNFALSPLFLRSDISISPYYFSGFDQEGEYILREYDSRDEPIFAQRYPKRILNPVKQITVDGVSILSIYKNSPEFVKKEYKKEEQMTRDFKVIVKKTNQIEIDLGRKVNVTRISVVNNLPTCTTSFATYIDEYIEFDSGSKFGLQEREKVPTGEIAFSFPAEETRFVRISIQDSASCFASGLVKSVSFLNP